MTQYPGSADVGFGGGGGGGGEGGLADAVGGVGGVDDADALALGAGRNGYLPAPAVEVAAVVLLGALLCVSVGVGVVAAVALVADASLGALAGVVTLVDAALPDACESGTCGAPANFTIANAPTDTPMSAAPIEAAMTPRDDFAGRAELTNGAAVIPGPLCAYAAGEGVDAPLIDGERCGP